MYDSVATLRAYTTAGFDKYGNKTTQVTDTVVYVQPGGVYHSEFYDAAQLGLKPELTLHITTRADYNGQKVVLFEGKEYSVIRVDLNAQRDGITLICEERVQNG